jgi:hypothetical protein
MNAQGITPTLAAALCSLAESQLQTQVSRSAALDAGAIGVMSVNAAISGVFIAAKADHRVWPAVAVLLGLSFGLAVRAILSAGAERIGPLVADVLDDRGRYDDGVLERWLLEDLAEDALANRWALARKMKLLMGAVAFAALAMAFGSAGVVG